MCCSTAHFHILLECGGSPVENLTTLISPDFLDPIAPLSVLTRSALLSCGRYLKKAKKYIITIIILFLPSLLPLPPLSLPLSPVLPIFLQSSHCLLSPTVLPDNKLVAFIRNLVNVWPGKFRDFNMIFKY